MLMIIVPFDSLIRIINMIRQQPIILILMQLWRPMSHPRRPTRPTWLITPPLRRDLHRSLRRVVLRRSNLKRQLLPLLCNPPWVSRIRWTSMSRWISMRTMFNTRQATDQVRMPRTFPSPLHMRHSITPLLRHTIPLWIIQSRWKAIVRRRPTTCPLIQWRANKRCFSRRQRITITKISRNCAIFSPPPRHQSPQEHRRQRWTTMTNESRNEHRTCRSHLSLSLILSPWAAPKASSSQIKPSEGRINRCRICGKIYARPSTLKTHLRTHSGEKVKSLRRYCGKESPCFLSSRTSVTSAAKHLLKRLISPLICERIQERNLSRVISVEGNSRRVHQWRHTCEHIRVNDPISVNIVAKRSPIVQH